jgi:TRAP-type transport system small permease protein
MSLSKFLDSVFEAMTTFLLASLVVLTMLQVVGRYGLETTFIWTEELARLALIYLTFIGSIVALRRSQLLRLDFLVDALPPSMRRWIGVAVDILSIVVLGVVVWQGIPLLWRFWPVLSAALNWPTTFFYFPVVIGCLAMLLVTCLNVVRALRTKGKDRVRKEDKT